MTVTIKGIGSGRFKITGVTRKRPSGFCADCKLVVAKPTRRHVVKSMLKEQSIHAHSAIKCAKFGFGV